MADAFGLLPVLLGGALLGAAFYGSLWWTVRRGLPSSRPALWFTCGMGSRAAVGVAGIWLIGDGRWERLVMCLLGFVLARPLVVRLTRPSMVRIDGPKR